MKGPYDNLAERAKEHGKRYFPQNTADEEAHVFERNAACNGWEQGYLQALRDTRRVTRGYASNPILCYRRIQAWANWYLTKRW